MAMDTYTGRKNIMSNNDITNDRITNAIKGDNKKYADGWDKIFGKSKDEMKEHVQQITGDVPHTVVEDKEDEQ